MEDRASRFVSAQNYLHDPYEHSRAHTIKWFCHAAIYALENGIAPDGNPHKIFEPSFYDAKYYQIRSKAEAIDILNDFGYPCVVHISITPANKGSDTQDHSFLVLGPDKSGDIVIWEKSGYAFPYQITNLDVQIEKYGIESFWGVRELGYYSNSNAKKA